MSCQSCHFGVNFIFSQCQDQKSLPYIKQLLRRHPRSSFRLLIRVFAKHLATWTSCQFLELGIGCRCHSHQQLSNGHFVFFVVVCDAMDMSKMKGSVELEEASTAVPADCLSDLETETTSKKSKAKRSDRRGPKRQAERARFQMSKRGRDVSGLTDAEVVALRDKVFAEERGTLDLASNQEASLEVDLMAKFFAELGALSVNTKYKSTEAERQAVHKYALKASRVYDKTWMKCQLCCGDKWADEKHLMSTSHLARVEEECYLNSVLGPSQNGRRFGPDGLYGCRTLSRSSMKLYWGGHIENMVSFARQRFQEGTMISYKYSKNRPAALVQGKHVKGVSLSVISYLCQPRQVSGWQKPALWLVFGSWWSPGGGGGGGGRAEHGLVACLADWVGPSFGLWAKHSCGDHRVRLPAVWCCPARLAIRAPELRCIFKRCLRGDLHGFAASNTAGFITTCQYVECFGPWPSSWLKSSWRSHSVIQKWTK